MKILSIQSVNIPQKGIEFIDVWAHSSFVV